MCVCVCLGFRVYGLGVCVFLAGPFFPTLHTLSTIVFLIVHERLRERRRERGGGRVDMYVRKYACMKAYICSEVRVHEGMDVRLHVCVCVRVHACKYL